MAITSSKTPVCCVLLGVLLTVDLAVSQTGAPGTPIIADFNRRPTLNTVITLSCTSTAASASDPPITIQWFINDFFVNGAVPTTVGLVTTSTVGITIDSRDMRNDEIKCVASNGIAQTPSSKTIIDVLQRPIVGEITPAAAFFDTGTTGTWTLNISDAYPSLVVASTPRWYINDIQTFQFVTSTTPNTLTETYSYTSTLTRVVSPSDHGQIIKCVIDHPTFDSGDVTKFQVMTIRYPPGQPQISTNFGNGVNENTILEANCSSQGGFPIPTVTWTGTDFDVTSSYTSGTAQVSQFRVAARVGLIGTTFTCTAENAMASFSASAILSQVFVQPAFPILTGPSEVYEGTAVNFTCETPRTNPASSLIWLLDAIQMAASFPVTPSTNNDGTFRTSSTINIVPTAQHNGTVLTCEAAHGTLPANLRTNITIIVRLKPSIVLTSSSNENVRIASAHSIDCEVTSSIEFNVTWWHTPVAGTPQMLTAGNSKYITWSKTSTIRTLSIQNYQSSDDGSYYAIAANRAGFSAPSASAQTTGYAIPVTPFIDFNQFNYYPVTGENVVMNCSSTGGVPITLIKWYRNDILVDTSWTTSNTNGNDITYNEYTHSVSFDDKGAIFKCEAGNAFGNTFTVTTFVDVYVRADISAGGISGDSNVIAGKNTTLTCTTTASYPQPVVEWWMGSERLLVNKVTPGTSDSNGALIVTSEVYFIPDQADSGKTVRCVVKQDILPHTASASLLITVHGPPSAIARPNSNKTLTEFAEFTCAVTSSLLPYNVTWYKKTSNTEGTRITSVNEKFAVDNSHPVYKLWIYGIDVSDNGIYYCIAQSAAGSSSKAEVSLTVFTAPSQPSFNGGESGQTVSENSNIQATCMTTVHPADTATFIWYYKDSAGETEVDSSFVTNNVLNIPSADRTKAGEYICVAFNSYGSERASFTVDIQYPPELDVGNVQTDIAATAEDLVVLSCNVLANPTPTAYLWTHESEEVATSKNLEVNVKAGVNTYTCVATNAMGSSQGLVFTIEAPQATVPGTGASTADETPLAGGVIAAIVLGVIFIIIILIICCVGCKYYKDKKKDGRTTKKTKPKHKPSSVAPDIDDRRSTLYPVREKDPAYLFGPARPQYRPEQRHYPRDIHDYYDYSQRGGYENVFHLPAPGSEMDDMSVYRETGFRSKRRRMPHALPPLATASYTGEAKRRKDRKKKNKKKRQHERQAGEGMENPAKSKDTSPTIVLDDNHPEKDAAQDTNVLLGDQFRD